MVIIEKNIPLTAKGKGKVLESPEKKMIIDFLNNSKEIMDSAEFEPESIVKLRSCLKNLRRKLYPERDYTMRFLGDGKYRIWRIK